MYSLEYAGHWTLKNVNPGSIFRLPGGGLALKTEYGDNDGFKHSYLLETGESCWADPNVEVIVLELVDQGESEYLKPSDKDYVPRMPREIPLDKVPQPNRDFAAGDMDAFDKRDEMDEAKVNENPDYLMVALVTKIRADIAAHRTIVSESMPDYLPPPECSLVARTYWEGVGRVEALSDVLVMLSELTRLQKEKRS